MSNVLNSTAACSSAKFKNAFQNILLLAGLTILQFKRRHFSPYLVQDLLLKWNSILKVEAIQPGLEKYTWGVNIYRPETQRNLRLI